MLRKTQGTHSKNCLILGGFHAPVMGAMLKKNLCQSRYDRCTCWSAEKIDTGDLWYMVLRRLQLRETMNAQDAQSSVLYWGYLIHLSYNAT
jgi:hypothetical protein